MIIHDQTWSLTRGNTLVPSRWQATFVSSRRACCSRFATADVCDGASGGTVTARTTGGLCEHCGDPTPAGGTGRPRKFCRPACRQAAYRGRQTTNGAPVTDVEQARALVSTLAGAARQLAHAVADPTAIETSARQAAAQRAASALAALTELAGLSGPARDVTLEPVTKLGTASWDHPILASNASQSSDGATAWTRSPDRATWVASTAGGIVLAVTRQAGGGWLPAVQSPGAPDTFGPSARTRTAAQQWAEQHSSDDLR
jgi:hypothetical protein